MAVGGVSAGLGRVEGSGVGGVVGEWREYVSITGCRGFGRRAVGCLEGERLSAAGWNVRRGVSVRGFGFRQMVYGLFQGCCLSCM